MKSDVCRVEKIANGFLIHWQEPVKRPPTPSSMIDSQVYGTASFGLRPYLLRDRTVFASGADQLHIEIGAAVKAHAEATRLQSEGALDAEDGPSAASGREKTKKKDGPAAPAGG
jgi:hypothetical protein